MEKYNLLLHQVVEYIVRIYKIFVQLQHLRRQAEPVTNFDKGPKEPFTSLAIHLQLISILKRLTYIDAFFFILVRRKIQ